MRYRSANDYMREIFGRKIYKISINGGFTGPNRDGTLGTRGCIFCSGAGSGDFSEDPALPISVQIEMAKKRVEAKLPRRRESAEDNPERSSSVDECAAERSNSGEEGAAERSSSVEEGAGERLNSGEEGAAERSSSGNGGAAEKLSSGGDGMSAKSCPRYMAYFQAFTNTYAPVDRLRDMFTEAIMHPDVVGLSIATRPDCLPEDVIDLLGKLNLIKPVWVELGLQTIHETTAEYIRRGYPLEVYTDVVKRLSGRVSHVITHVIIGLPGESLEDILETVRYVGNLSREVRTGMADIFLHRHESETATESESLNQSYCEIETTYGIKLQLLHVIRGTDLEEEYKKGAFECLSMDEYVNIVHDAIELLPEEMVVHRITGDGAKKTLIAPLWSADKKRVLNSLNRVLNKSK